MGRFAIGKTRNEIIITSQSYADGVTDLGDMFDAWAMLEAFCVREIRKNGQTGLFDELFEQSRHWRNLLTGQGILEQIKRKLKVTTYTARIEFGKRLLNVEFRD